MPETQTALIVETLVEALETMAFMTVMPAETPCPVPAELRIITVRFTHPSPGAIELAAPAALGHALAGNLLGTDPNDPQAVAGGDDALRELVNITCGLLLHKHAGKSAQPMLMSVPCLEPADSARWDQLVLDSNTQVLDAEGSVFAVRLTGID